MHHAYAHLIVQQPLLEYIYICTRCTHPPARRTTAHYQVKKVVHAANTSFCEETKQNIAYDAQLYHRASIQKTCFPPRPRSEAAKIQRA